MLQKTLIALSVAHVCGFATTEEVPPIWLSAESVSKMVDFDFCNRLKEEKFAAPGRWCSSIKSPEDCGWPDSGSKSYRISKKSKFDGCVWRENSCKLSGITYACHPSCLEGRNTGPNGTAVRANWPSPPPPPPSLPPSPPNVTPRPPFQPVFNFGRRMTDAAPQCKLPDGETACEKFSVLEGKWSACEPDDKVELFCSSDVECASTNHDSWRTFACLFEDPTAPSNPAPGSWHSGIEHPGTKLGICINSAGNKVKRTVKCRMSGTTCDCSSPDTSTGVRRQEILNADYYVGTPQESLAVCRNVPARVWGNFV